MIDSFMAPKQAIFDEFIYSNNLFAELSEVPLVRYQRFQGAFCRDCPRGKLIRSACYLDNMKLGDVHKRLVSETGRNG